VHGPGRPSRQRAERHVDRLEQPPFVVPGTWCHLEAS
jgi:hypothetical protein